MKKIKIMVAILLSIILSTSYVRTIYAFNSTKKTEAYSYYLHRSVGTMEARVWVSTLKTNWAQTKVLFDATTSSWVWNPIELSQHRNTMKISVFGLSSGCSLSATGTSVSVTGNDSCKATIAANPTNSYYNGVTAYNNVIARNIAGVLNAWNPVTRFMSYVSVTVESQQSVYLSGNLYYNSAATTALY